MKKKRRAVWFGVGAGVGAALGIVSLVLVTGAVGGSGVSERSPIEIFPTRADAGALGAPPVRIASSDGRVMVSSDEGGGGVPGAATEGSAGMAGEGPSSVSAGDEAPVLPDMSPQPCDFPQFIGQPVDETALKAIGRPFRILPPGGMATMDFSPARINVETDDKGIVTRIHCG